MGKRTDEAFHGTAKQKALGVRRIELGRTLRLHGKHVENSQPYKGSAKERKDQGRGKK